VGGYCHLAGADRVFRLDRIRAAELLETTFDAPPQPAAPVAYDPDPAAPRVVLDLEPSARWVVDQYPNDRIEELGGGRVRVVLPVTARPWLERLLVRLGADAEVVDLPDALGDDPARQAARRILARYQATGAGRPAGPPRSQRPV
jgi:proteasome accessory factor C